jgi:hypothetical protein
MAFALQALFVLNVLGTRELEGSSVVPPAVQVRRQRLAEGR